MQYFIKLESGTGEGIDAELMAEVHKIAAAELRTLDEMVEIFLRLGLREFRRRVTEAGTAER